MTAAKDRYQREEDALDAYEAIEPPSWRHEKGSFPSFADYLLSTQTTKPEYPLFEVETSGVYVWLDIFRPRLTTAYLFAYRKGTVREGFGKRYSS